MSETDDNPAPPTADRAAIRRRRRWLAAFALLAVATIVSVVVVQLFAGEERAEQRDRQLGGESRPVVLERFDLKPRRGKSRRGLAEFIRRDGRTYLRMIAAGLSRTYGEEVYQASLSRRGDEKVLGGRPVDSKGIFLGQTRMTAEELHAYDRIELRLVGGDATGAGRLILRGEIPG